MPGTNLENVSLSTLRLSPKLLTVEVDDNTPNATLEKIIASIMKLTKKLNHKMKNGDLSPVELTRLHTDLSLLLSYGSELHARLNADEVIHTDGKRYIEGRWPFPKCICSCGGDGCDFCDGYSCGCRTCERLLRRQ